MIKDNHGEELVISLVSLVKSMNNAPSKEGYRAIKKRSLVRPSLQVDSPKGSDVTGDSSEVFDIIPEIPKGQDTKPHQVEPASYSEFDPSRYFALGGNTDLPIEDRDNNVSPTIEKNPGKEYYEPISFGVVKPEETPSNYTSREVLEMIRELKALRD